MATENLFPEGYETETIDIDEVDDSMPIGYLPGVAFDLQTGDFIRDGRNMLVSSTGIESWQSWVINCMQTERYKHLAYDTDFGIELDEVFSSSTREEAESILTREITEAIMADPYQRTAYIDQMTFNWTAPDAVQVQATIVGIEDVTIDVTAYITGSES